MADVQFLLTEECLSDSKRARDDLYRVIEANRVFDLGLCKKTLSRFESVSALMAWLGSDAFLSLSFFQALLYDMEAEGGRPVDGEARADARRLRDLGCSEVAQVVDDYYDLVAATPRDAARNVEEDSPIARSPAVEAALEALRRRWCDASTKTFGMDIAATYSDIHRHHAVPQNVLHGFVMERFGVATAPREDFEGYWTQSIMDASGFAATQQVQERLGRTLTGPLTDKLIGVLSAKGYHVEFAFWQQALPIEGSSVGARTRGYVYLQTSNGPIRLFDPTDEVSLRTYFPVHVETVDGTPLFEITEADDLGLQKSGWIASMLRSFAGGNP